MKCSVCFEVLQDKDSRGLDYYVCSFCGTRQPKFVSTDFDKRKIISDANDALYHGDLNKANRYINDYETQYPEDNSEDYINMKGIVNTGVIYTKINTNTYKSRLDNSANHGTAVVLQDINRIQNNKEAILEYFNNNTIIHNSLEKTFSYLDKVQVKNDALLILKSDSDFNLDIYEANKTIVLDLDSDMLEAMVLKNIKTAKGLAIYCGQTDFMKNAYVLNLFYRFRKLNKPVVFLYSNSNCINTSFSDSWINVNDSNRDNKISQILNNQSIDEILYETDGSLIVSIQDGKVIETPKYATGIKSRCGYKKQIEKLVISNNATFTIMERAFEKSTLEELIVNQENCELFIEPNAFFEDESLKSIEILAKTSMFGVGCFKDCINLYNINISKNSSTTVFEHAFENIHSLDELKLLGKAKIKKHAFRDTKINNLIISSDVDIEDFAFNKCTNVNINGGACKGSIAENSFPVGTNIIIVGKELKNYYLALSKQLKGVYNIKFKK